MKKKIALLTGGYSGEAEISYLSAITIYNNLDKAKYDVFKIDISPNGWIYEDEDGKKSVLDKNDFSINTGAQKVRFDAVFIGIHGTPGEDGKLQGYFDMLHIPYTSCNAATSALTFNKRYTTAVAGMSGIAVAKSVLLIKDQFTNADEIVNTLHFPVFVKPNNGGSSIGMSKVTEASEALGIAIGKAFKEDDQVLVEEMISGREFTVGVFRSAGAVSVINITEVSTDKEFFDFEAKYKGKSKEVTPAVMPDTWKEKVEAAAKKIYEVFNCSGVIRIDFIYNEAEDTPYMLEINTVPGQSEASIIPQQVRARGWSLPDFYSALVDEAVKG
jgi:D-alanine-D-alanine ligase